MNQFTKTVKMLAKRTALFLAFALMLTAIIATAISAGNGDPTMTVIFDPAECQIKLTYPGIEDEPIFMENGVAVEIPYGKAVTVTVEPLEGYQLTDIIDADNPTNSIMSLYAPTYYNQNFLSSVRAQVICSTRVFDVKFEKEDVIHPPYTFPGIDNPADLAALKYHYKQPGNLTYLPEVERTGYTFDHWSVIKSDGTEVQKITTKDEDGRYYIHSEIINTDMGQKGTIYLHAEFKPDPQPLTRYDYLYNEATGQRVQQLGSYQSGDKWQALMDMEVSGLTQMGDDNPSDDPENPYLNYKSYPGYKLLTDMSKYDVEFITKPTEQNPNPNVFYRLYLPVVYTLVYENLRDGVLPEGAPQTYTYGVGVDISVPTRRGYDFVGWQVTIDGKTVDENTGDKFSLGKLDAEGNAQYAAKDERIVLTAIWQAKEFSIDYEWAVNNEDLDNHLDELNAALPKSFIFDSEDPISTLAISDPAREGYSFVKWILHYTNAEGNPATVEVQSTDGVYLLSCNDYAENIVLEAVWQAKKYTVALDGQGAADGFTTRIENVEFDAALTVPTEGFVLPEKLGFTFAGYWSAAEGGTKYINADGTSNCDVWDLYQDTDGVITLYAQWTRNSYEIIVDVTGIPAGTDGLLIEIITATGTHIYGTQKIELPFETEFTVKITTPSGYKTVVWNGTEVAHSAIYTSPAVAVGADVVRLTAEAREMRTVTAPVVDYINEQFILTPGEYLIYIDINNPIRVTVTEEENRVAIPNEFFGQAVQFVLLGGDTHSDSDAYPVQTVARYDAPAYGDALTSIGVISDTQVKIQMSELLAGLYEFAIAHDDGNGIVLKADDWKKTDGFSYLFEGLQPGTTYHVFIRRAATEQAPCGKVYSQPIATSITQYLPSVFDRLNDMLTEEDGDIAKAVIQDAINTINGWKGEDGAELPETFYTDVEALIAAIEAKLAFARLQDSKIAALEAFLADCLSSGSFNDTNKALLSSLCAGAVADIAVAGDEAAVNSIYNTAKAAMDVVPVTYLYDDANIMQLLSKLGLNQDSAITLLSKDDLKALRRAVSDAVIAGNVSAGSFITQEQADLMLRTLEVVGAYSFNLINAQVQEGEVFTLRMAIPAALSGKTGLQVAYYNETTGAIEILETVQEGDTLVFKATHIADFVIMADPTIDLTVLIIALGAIVVLQLIAIALVLVSRSKGKALSQNACVALPMFLTIHFIPQNSALIALALGAAVVILQVVLTWLLIASGMIRMPKIKKSPKTQKEVPAVVIDDVPAESAYAEETAAEETEALSEEEDAEQSEQTAPDEVAEEAEAEEFYDDEEFIEPAVNPYYSLPEEDGFVYDEEIVEDAQEAGEESVYEAETEDSSAEGTEYGGDPFDGVFGTDGFEDGNSYDEAGDSEYAESYGESFEYDNAEDAYYAETEDADGEAQPDEGAVDPYAYVVEDESEEISDDEEMYRYDE